MKKEQSKDEEISITGDELEGIPAPVLRRMIRRLKARRLADRDPEDSKREDEESETERQKLADLHEESKGDAPKVPVEEDDLPEGMYEAAGEDCDEGSCADSSAVESEKPSKGGRKA